MARTVKRRHYVCQLVAGKGGVLTARCGLEYRQPKEGGFPPGIAAYRYDCPDCAAETVAIMERLTTSVASP